MLTAFLGTPSGGLRPLAVTTALLRTIGTALGLFSHVEGQGINEADAAGGAPGDVLCYCHDDPDRLCLVVEVKDIDLRRRPAHGSGIHAFAGRVVHRPSTGNWMSGKTRRRAARGTIPKSFVGQGCHTAQNPSAKFSEKTQEKRTPKMGISGSF